MRGSESRFGTISWVACESIGGEVQQMAMKESMERMTAVRLRAAAYGIAPLVRRGRSRGRRRRRRR